MQNQQAALKKLKVITLLFLFPIFIVKGQYSFIQNKGQLPNHVFSKTNLPGGALFLEKGKLTYAFYDSKKLYQIHKGEEKDRIINAHAYEVSFKAINKNIEFFLDEESPFFENYYVGNKADWAENVRSYKTHIQKNLYNNIDLMVYEKEGSLKYELIIHPTGDPKQIKWKYKKVNTPTIRNGDLNIQTNVNTILEKSPYAYQKINGEEIQIPCIFQLKNKTFSYKLLGEYNKQYPLIIDPTLIFSTYSGSTADNFGYTATYDNKGFLYSGSTSFGIGYPTTLGAYQINFSGGVGSGGTDIAITKYDTTGSFRVYSTYLGGDMDELPHSMIVNNLDELFIFGTTGSLNYPTTPSAYDTSFNGGNNFVPQGIGVSFPNGVDIVVSKMSSNGGSLLSSTYLGGSSNDGLNIASKLKFNYADEARGEIDIDKNNNIYIATCTQSPDFPLKNPFQPTYQGGQEGCIVKMDRELSSIIWSSYLSGSKEDAIYSLAIDSNNDIFVAGGTTSLDFPTTPFAYNSNYLDSLDADAFVSKIQSDGSQLLNSTYFGSTNYDQAYFVEISNNLDVYLFGQTKAQGNSLIFNTNYFQVNGNQFISIFSPDLSVLKKSTVVGSGKGSPDISPTAFLVDVCNRVYFSGWGSNIGGGTLSTLNLPVTANCFQSTTDGNDFYLMVINESLDSVVYATYFGGSQSAEHVDGGTSRFDKKGIIYQSVCAGCGGNSDFPIYPNPGAVSLTNNSTNCNNGVFKFNMDFEMVIADFSAPIISCSSNIIFSNLSSSQSPIVYFWDFGDGFSSSQTSPTHSYSQPGEYTVRLIAMSMNSCNVSDTIIKNIYILSEDSISQNLLKIEKCKEDQVQIGIPSSNSYANYFWLPSYGLSSTTISNPHTVTDSTIEYKLIISVYSSSGGVECIDTITQLIEINDIYVNAGEDTTYCSEPVLLIADHQNLTNIIWSSNRFFSDTLSQNDSLLIFSGGKFFVKVENQNCFSIDSVQVFDESANIFLDGSSEICKGDTAFIQANNLNPNVSINSYHWHPSNVIYSLDSAIIMHSPDSSQWYQVQIINNQTCIFLDSFFVKVFDYPILDSLWTNKPVIYKGEKSILYAATKDSVFWETNETTKSISVTPLQDTYYNLIIFNEGCAIEDSIFIQVKDVFCNEEKIFIPNAFTPGEDQKNDTYLILDNEGIVTSFFLEIFSRSGQKVFSTNDINNGWDGNFNNEMLPSQVFDFYLKIECVGNKELFKKGNITLIR